jgi:hypothetical protein
MYEKIFREPTFSDIMDNAHHIELVDMVQDKKEEIGLGLNEDQKLDYWLWLNSYFQSHAISPVSYKHTQVLQRG